jgi:hypothetical protein
MVDATTERRSTSQRRWVSLFWWAAGISVVGTLLVPVLNDHHDATPAVGPGVSSLAACVGALMTRRLARQGLDDADFIKGTTTVRAVALSWMFLFAFVVGGAFIGAWFSHGMAYDAGWLFGTFQRDLVSLIGFASLIAIVGPGYSEYRGAMAINAQKPPRVQL